MTEGKKLDLITSEVEKEAAQLAKAPMFGARIAAPLRLLVVWMKAVNAQMTRIENHLEGQR
ncbi:hypothetical protein [Enterovibrio norvegicus]|uniref:hypothetical protein n=1 Tax=Enterovibrio norvegicus TaxID=188144 RepID=UPI0035533F26